MAKEKQKPKISHWAVMKKENIQLKKDVEEAYKARDEAVRELQTLKARVANQAKVEWRLNRRKPNVR